MGAIGLLEGGTGNVTFATKITGSVSSTWGGALGGFLGKNLWASIMIDSIAL